MRIYSILLTFIASISMGYSCVPSEGSPTGITLATPYTMAIKAKCSAGKTINDCATAVKTSTNKCPTGTIRFFQSLPRNIMVNQYNDPANSSNVSCYLAYVCQ